MKLEELVENPDNPSIADAEELKRLSGKLERVPLGLTAMRIAYVTDKIPGKKMVISGNKRLRVLKQKFGDSYDIPDEWTQDVTSMSEAERHEFIVSANVSDGHWDVDKLLEQYSISELQFLVDDNYIEELISKASNEANDISNAANSSGKSLEVAIDMASVPGKQYSLGVNWLICRNAKECDEIRKFFTKLKTESENCWETYTPEKE